MPRRKALRKNYSKKAIRRRSATKRKRLGRGLWFTRRAKIHPVLSVYSPIVSPRLTESTPPDFEPFDPYANYVLNMPRHIGIIKRSAQALEQIYNDYPELFNKIRHGYMKHTTEYSDRSLYNDSYARDYEAFIKLLIQKLPNKDIQQYSEEEKDDTLNILADIRSRSSQFLDNIDIDKFESGQNFNEFEEIIFTQFTSVLRLIIKHCQPYNFE
jgi:hypothetical protein